MSSIPMVQAGRDRFIASHTATDGRELPILYDPTGVALTPGDRAPDTDVGPLRVEDWRLERFREHLEKNITPARLAAAHDQAESGEPGIAEDIHEAMLEKDTRLGSLIAMRAAAALASSWEIVPARTSDPEADKVRDDVAAMVAETNFEDLRADLLLATPFGMAIDWQTWGLNDGVQAPVRFDRMRLNKFIWHPKRDELRLNIGRQNIEGEPIKPGTTVRATFLSRGEHASRAGLMRPLSWLYLFKLYALQDYSLFVDRYGIPSRIVFIPRSDYLKPDMIARVRQSIRFLISDSSGVFPDDSRVEIGKGIEGIPVHSGFLEDLHKMMAWGVVGHELAAQGATTGNFGVSAAKRVDETFVRTDNRMVETTVERDVFLPYVTYNRGWDKRHLTPKLQHRAKQAPEEVNQKLSVVTGLAKTFGDGLAFSRTQIRKDFGLAPPIDAEELEADDVLLPQAPPAPTFGAVPGGQQPGPTPEQEAGAGDGNAGDDGEPPASLRRVASVMDQLRGAMEKMVPGQRSVDGLAEKGMSDALAELTGWPTPMRRMVLQAAREGWSHEKLHQGLAGLYTALTSTETEKALYQRSTLAKVYGLSTRPK
jgi:phage gp29-like protein